MSKGIALVTGGTRGIGKALCLRLKDSGYQVFSASRSKSLPQGMDEITQVSVDFTNSLETRSFAQKFLEQYGVPNLLINNAGYGAFYEWADFPEDEINRQIQVLFSSPVELCRVFAPAMQKEGRGLILNLSSLATLYPLPFMPLYNAGKSALSSFTESMMLEYPKFPRFIDFRMGDVRTDFNRSASKSRIFQDSTKNAWAQMEKQLKASITPKVAVGQIYNRIIKDKSGTFYGGTCLHCLILPFIYRYLSSSLKLFLIRWWYR